MALMERVATLLRANLNELIERAEDPEKMLKQLMLDMENQLLQVKTQVAMALADGHLLEKKAREQEQAVASWHRKAELAVNKGDDELARAALERALSHDGMVKAFQAQVAEQNAESEALRGAYLKLQSKLDETKGRCEILIAQHRRAKMIARATEARLAAEGGASGRLHVDTVSRMQNRIEAAEIQSQAGKALLSGDSLEDRLLALEREDRVEQLLSELKRKQERLLAAG